MVVVASSQPNELEQKRKRQTLERAKANHLSKQLQMRLQYAKLKVEYGWQRQNLNEVENLYFHHSHQRNMRQGAGQRTTATYPHGAPVSAEPHAVQSPASSAVLDQIVGPFPLANDALSSGSSALSPSKSPSEHSPSADGLPVSQPSSYPPVQTPAPVTPATIPTNHPPSALDLSDPDVLAHLAQLQAQVQLPLQPQHAQTASHHPSTTVPSTCASTSAFQPGQGPVLLPVPIPAPAPGALPPHVQFSQPPQPGFTLLGTLTPGSVPSYTIPGSAPHNPVAPAQPPVSVPIPVPIPVSASTSAPIAPIPTASIPVSTPIAPSALTYDSFWSTHASSTGPTRALYRTHTGFTASAAPGGNVAMLTPGGHAAVLTAEGVYVGGGNK